MKLAIKYIATLEKKGPRLEGPSRHHYYVSYNRVKTLNGQ